MNFSCSLTILLFTVIVALPVDVVVDVNGFLAAAYGRAVSL
ncbi:MAG TPA: hypothetical protein VGQ81_06035 [Acidobacteriota bacterium]|nr:hypothetical protein [Acidobacteriota bacterium]